MRKVLCWPLHRDVMGLLLAVGLGASLIALNAGVIRPRRYHKMCQSNMKQMGLAFMQYSRDYDESFPLAHNWAEALWPYSKNQSIFYCPTRGDSHWGYALNSRAAPTSHVEMYAPADTVLAFESDANRINAIDSGTSLPKAPIHPQGHTILFGDGHVKPIEKPDFARGFDPALVAPLRRARKRADAAFRLQLKAAAKKVNTPRPTR